VIVNPSNRDVYHDTTGLAFVGAIRPATSGDPFKKRAWFCKPEHMEDVRQQFEATCKREGMAESSIMPDALVNSDMVRKFNDLLNKATEHKRQTSGEPRKANTKLELTYTCGSAKSHLTAVLAGAITEDQINTISKNLIDGYQIVAPQLHLPSPLEAAVDNGDIPGYTEDDHPLTILSAWEDGIPAVNDLLTFDEPNVSINISDLTTLTTKILWDHMSEMDRLGIPDFDLEELDELDEEDELEDSPGIA